MRILLKTLKASICFILVISMVFGITTVAGAATSKSKELADMTKASQSYLNPTDEEKEAYPNGAMMLPINVADMEMKMTYSIHIYRQGGTEGQAKITLKSIDMTAEYGNDYKILTSHGNIFSSEVKGKANPYYGIQNESYIPVVTKQQTQYLNSESNEELAALQTLSSNENDSNLTDKMPISSSTDIVFEDGENDKCVYVETLQNDKVSDDKTFMLALSNPEGCKIGGDTCATYTIKETREKPKAYVQVKDLSLGLHSDTAYIKVQRSGNVGGYCNVYFNTESGENAKALEIYKPVAMKLTFLPGMTEIKVPVPIIASANDGDSFKAYISDVDNAEVIKERATITFSKNEAAMHEHENSYTFSSVTDNSNNVTDSLIKNTTASIINTSASSDENESSNVPKADNSSDYASVAADADAASTSSTDYRSAKRRGVLYLDLSDFSMDDNYVRCKGTITDKSKTQIGFKTDHGFSFYHHVTGIRSNSTIDFTGAKSLHVCYDHMFGSVSGDTAAVTIADSSPISSKDSDANWMSKLSGHGTSWNMWDISSSNMEKSFDLSDEWTHGNHTLYFSIFRTACPGDCGLNVQSRGDDSDLSKSTYIQLRKYNISILNPDEMELIVDNQLKKIPVVTNAEMIDPGSKSSSQQTRVTTCDIYRDEQTTILYAVNEKYSTMGVKLNGVVFCDPNNHSNQSELISLDYAGFTLTPAIINKYSSFFKDDKIVIKPVFEMPKSTLTVEKHEDTKTKTSFIPDAGNCTGDITQDGNKIGTISWTKSPRKDGSYLVGDQITFKTTKTMGDYLTTYSTRAAETKDLLPSAQIITYDNGKSEQVLNVSNLFYSVTPNVVVKDSDTKLIVKNPDCGLYCGKGQKYETKNDDGSVTIKGYIDNEKSDVAFSSYRIGGIIHFNARPNNGYRAKWQYKDSASHQIKTYYGSAFYFAVQNAYEDFDNDITLTFEKSDKLKEITITGTTSVQKGSIINPPMGSDVYELCPNALVMMEGYSSLSDGQGAFTLYKDQNAKVKETARVAVGEAETHRALAFYNNQYYIVDINLADSKRLSGDTYKADIKLDYKSVGIRPTKVNAYDNDGVVYNDTITLVKTKPIQFDVYFSREGEDEKYPVNMARWTIENKKGGPIQSFDIDIDKGASFVHFATIISEIAHEGDKLMIELFNKSYDSSASAVYKSFGKYNTGYNFVATAIEETITYMPDLGVYSTASTDVSNTMNENDIEPLADPLPCIGPISPMVSLFGFKPIFSVGPIGEKDAEGHDLYSVQIGFSFGEIKDKCAQDPKWQKLTPDEQIDAMIDKVCDLDEAYNGENPAPAFGGGRAINLNTAVCVSFSASFCFQSYYYTDKDTGEWRFTSTCVVLGGGGSISVSIPFVLLYLPCFVFFTFSADVRVYLGVFPNKENNEGKTSYLTLKELNNRNLSKFQGITQLKFNISFGLGIGLDALMSAKGHLDNTFDIQMQNFFNAGKGTYKLSGGVTIEFLFFSKDWGGDIVDAVMFDTTKGTSAGSVMSEALNREDILKNTTLDEMEVTKCEVTDSNIASLCAGEETSETIIATSENQDKTRIAPIGDDKYFVTSYKTIYNVNGSQHNLHYSIYDRKNATANGTYSLVQKAIADADLPNSNIDKKLLQSSLPYIDASADVTDAGDDLIIVWSKCLTDDNSNLKKLLSLQTYFIMYNKQTGNFHDLKVLPDIKDDTRMDSSPKVVYNKQTNVAQVFYKTIDAQGVEDNTSIQELVEKPIIVYTTAVDLSKNASKFGDSIQVLTDEKTIKYMDAIAYKDKILLSYVASDSNGFTLEDIGDTKYDPKYLNKEKFNTVNAMYLNTYEFEDGNASLKSRLQMTDIDYVVANPKFVRAEDEEHGLDNVLIFYKSNGKYAYQNLQTILANGIYEVAPNDYKTTKEMMIPNFISDDEEHTINDDLIVRYNNHGNIYAFWTVSEGKQQQIWSSNFTITDVKLVTETTVLDDKGQQVYDKDGNAVMKPLDNPFNVINGIWGGKNYVSTGGINNSEHGMYKEAFDATILDDGRALLVYNAYDYTFFPEKPGSEEGKWKPTNDVIVVSEFDLETRYSLPEENQIKFSSYYPIEGENVAVTMKAKNEGVDAGRNVDFNLYVNGSLYDKQTINLFYANEWNTVESIYTVPKGVDPSTIEMYYTITEDGVEKARSEKYTFNKDARIVLDNASISPLDYYDAATNKVKFVLTADVWNTGNEDYEGGDILKFVNSDLEVLARSYAGENLNKTDAYYTYFGETSVPQLKVGEKRRVTFVSSYVPKSVFEKSAGQDSANLEFIIESKDDKAWKVLRPDEKINLISSINIGQTQTPKPYEGKEIQANDVTVFTNSTTGISCAVLPDEASYYEDLEFTSEDESIATVNELGVVTGVKEGTTKIVISDGALAKEINVTVENPYGDADKDGKVTIVDVTKIQKYLAKLDSQDSIDVKKANVNAEYDSKGADRVTIISATLIQRYKAKIIDTFPVCK